jgi:hypothetical protein
MNNCFTVEKEFCRHYDPKVGHFEQSSFVVKKDGVRIFATGDPKFAERYINEQSKIFDNE